jgi:hypothetical protein
VSGPATLEEWLGVAQFFARYFAGEVRKKRLDPLAAGAWRVGERRSVTIGGRPLGWASLPAPATVVRNKDDLLAWCRKHLPEAIETAEQVRPETAAALVEQVKKHGGWLRNGDVDDIVPVDGIEANALSPRVELEKDAEDVIRAAWAAGQIDLGMLLALPAVPVPVPDPEPVPLTTEREPFGPPFCDEHGFKSPVMAAAHAVMVQGGFSTPPVEAYRMIRDGGVMRERALAWLAEAGLDPGDPREGKDTPWPLPERDGDG